MGMRNMRVFQGIGVNGASRLMPHGFVSVCLMVRAIAPLLSDNVWAGVFSPASAQLPAGEGLVNLQFLLCSQTWPLRDCWLLRWQ